MNSIVKKENRLPREVWVAGMSLKGLWPEKTIEKRMKDVLERMESFYAFEPDLICLPETINTSWVDELKTLEEVAEDETTPGPITRMLAEVARKQNCYITCPIVTKKEGHFYNSSILLNRQGKIEGVFHKVHPTATEVIPEAYFKGGGVTPGAVKGGVLKTDFGTVGTQICFDAEWSDGWHSLKEDGAEIVCFPSQGPFSNTLSNHAWVNHYYIVASTGEDSQIIDMTGDIIASDGEFARWVCAPVNLEKELLHIWPHTLKFKDIQKKYGRKIRFKIYHPENWATLESRDPDVKVKDILKEYEIPTYDEHIREATEIQEKHRL
ncbi:MAG TPA: carbon-nitrogen hydrolase family protein [Cyclobacteriaceae bacterium]|nr:carbon-nitrogen hydrolase family protein [Cyclobacteriaceae bacterium]